MERREAEVSRREGARQGKETGREFKGREGKAMPGQRREARPGKAREGKRKEGMEGLRDGTTGEEKGRGAEGGEARRG